MLKVGKLCKSMSTHFCSKSSPFISLSPAKHNEVLSIVSCILLRDAYKLFSALYLIPYLHTLLGKLLHGIIFLLPALKFRRLFIPGICLTYYSKCTERLIFSGFTLSFFHAFRQSLGCSTNVTSPNQAEQIGEIFFVAAYQKF